MDNPGSCLLYVDEDREPKSMVNKRDSETLNKNLPLRLGGTTTVGTCVTCVYGGEGDREGDRECNRDWGLEREGTITVCGAP